MFGDANHLFGEALPILWCIFAGVLLLTGVLGLASAERDRRRAQRGYVYLGGGALTLGAALLLLLTYRLFAPNVMTLTLVDAGICYGNLLLWAIAFFKMRRVEGRR